MSFGVEIPEYKNTRCSIISLSKWNEVLEDP